MMYTLQAEVCTQRVQWESRETPDEPLELRESGDPQVKKAGALGALQRGRQEHGCESACFLKQRMSLIHRGYLKIQVHKIYQWSYIILTLFFF